MTTYGKMEEEFNLQLTGLYDPGEISSIFSLAAEYAAGFDFTRLVTERHTEVPPGVKQKFSAVLEQLLAGEPIQYVLSYAWFYGHKFRVTPSVLIPRRETEELVDLVVRDHKGKRLRVLDIGTGSGCIAISLKLALPASTVHALDISDEALDIARSNAKSLGADIIFIHDDVSRKALWDILPEFDVIVSNPPYIPLSEKEKMPALVTGNEPHLALFVPDNDALRFYRLIAELASEKLERGGHIYVEIHEDLSKAVKDLFEETGVFDKVRLHRDMQGKFRMAEATKSV